MNRKFDVWIDPTLPQARIVSILRRIPTGFGLGDIKVGIPNLSQKYIAISVWRDFPMPETENTVFIWNRRTFYHDDDTLPAAGAGEPIEGGSRVSVSVSSSDTEEVVYARIWHELLHAVAETRYSDPRPDDMKIDVADWLPRLLWLPYIISNYTTGVDLPVWHKMYYDWLTKNWLKNEYLMP